MYVVQVEHILGNVEKDETADKRFEQSHGHSKLLRAVHRNIGYEFGNVGYCMRRDAMVKHWQDQGMGHMCPTKTNP